MERVDHEGDLCGHRGIEAIDAKRPHRTVRVARGINTFPLGCSMYVTFLVMDARQDAEDNIVG